MRERLLRAAWLTGVLLALAGAVTLLVRRAAPVAVPPPPSAPPPTAAPAPAPAASPTPTATPADAPEPTIKGNRTSMLFHPLASPYWGRTKADAWFVTETEARAAGYFRYDDPERPRRAR